MGMERSGRGHLGGGGEEVWFAAVAGRVRGLEESAEGGYEGGEVGGVGGVFVV